MDLFGLHPLDILILVAYLAAITYIGKRMSVKISSEEDFFIAGRSLNKFFQYFLNMGTLIDANTAVRTASFTFNKGLGGVWLLLSHVFTGPYYWFMAGWFRRVRLVTMAELFQERFKSRLLPSIYALTGIWLSILIIGIGYKASLRTFQAMTIKPIEKCSPAEIAMMAEYREFVRLDNEYRAGLLDPQQAAAYARLESLYKTDRISAFVSYTKPFWFYLLYTVFVGTYVVLGGLKAAAVTDMLQGILIIAFSFILIPLALTKLGGWSQFSAAIPGYMLAVFGSGSNEFALNSIAALALVTIIGITGHQGNMTMNGSARDELTAQIASIGGAYTKRVLTIVWALCGLFAYALYRHSISDPDMAWGVLSDRLLGPGLRGIMIAGILAANMSTLDAVCVYLSGLFVRHLYKPFVPDRSQRHYINVSRAAIVLFLLLGILVSVTNTSIIHLVKALPSLNVIFGAPVLLLLFWKRLTLKAVYTQVIFCSILFAILPHTLPLVDSVRYSPWLTRQTSQQTIEGFTLATEEDVRYGRAQDERQRINRAMIVPPTAIYYDAVARRDPTDPQSPMMGIGRLNTEMILADLIGIDLRSASPSALLAYRYLVVSILPFLILIPVSWCTHDSGLQQSIARFYVKMKTPVKADPQQDLAELNKSYADPHRFDHTKLFPHSNWEFCKWTKTDAAGFLVSTATTAGIIFLFWSLIRWIA
ncbi:MAG: sodium:solute symporter family protein [Planctomycetaceae bacterium]|nr:sodium:solute symporter family protein [Planctomycetaceae bacterium]